MEKLGILVLNFTESYGTSESVFQHRVETFYLAVITCLEKYDELKIHFYFSGIFLDLLEKIKNQELISKVIHLVRQGKAEILPGLYYEPNLSTINQDSAQIHFDFSKEYWTKKGIKILPGLYLPIQALAQRSHLLLNWDWLDKFFLTNKLQYLLSSTDLEDHNNEQGFIFVCQESTALSLKAGAITPFINLGDLINQNHALNNSIPPQEISKITKQVIEGLQKNYENFPLLSSLSFTAIGDGTLDLTNLKTRVSNISQVLPNNYLFLQSRANDLRLEFETFLKAINSTEQLIPNKDRFTKAKRFLAQSQINIASLSDIQARQEFFKAIISAQVELDTLNNPEIDPTLGWVSIATRDVEGDGERELIIDTQLLRCYIKPKLSGGIIELDYKPRKVNLCNNLPGFSSIDYLQNGLLTEDEPQQHLPQKATVISKTLDLLCLRLSGELINLGMGQSKFILNKNITFKAGIGAHLNNSTTGLTIESWIEGNSLPLENQFFVTSWNLIFPSAVATALSAKTLLCVGGVNSENIILDKSILFDVTTAPGGLYGLRFIDGINGFVVDFRTSKQLEAIFCSPLEIKDQYQGIQIKFYINAQRIYCDNKSLTLFISIV